MDFILLLGHKRCGNHLLIHWMSRWQSNVYHWNNCWPYDKDIDVNALTQKLNSEPLDDFNVVILNLEHPQQWSTAIQKRVSDYAQNRFNQPNIYFPHIIRDPLNWIASYIFKYKPTNEAEIVDYYNELQDWLWRIWLTDFWNWLKDDFAIDYNQFVKSQSYRKTISKKLGFDWIADNDERAMKTLWCHEEVPVPSSFDTDLVEQGQMIAMEMQVLQRYKTIECVWHRIPQEIKDIGNSYWGISC